MSLRCTLDILLEQVSIDGEMLICGGGSKSAVWRQIFADIYNMPILKTNVDQNAASLGAAALAANACGMWTGYDKIEEIHITQNISVPNPEHVEVYNRLLPVYRRWTKALAMLENM